jgi:branched-chain amino acid transport system ATP-binding protein
MTDAGDDPGAPGGQDRRDGWSVSSGGGGPPGLVAIGVSVQFGGIRALDAVDLQVERGRCMGLIGPNGAGKTTLLDAVSGLRRVNDGRIEMAGVDISGMSPTGRARLGMRRTFQRPQCFGGLTVRENVAVALEWRKQARRLLRDLFVRDTWMPGMLDRQGRRVSEVIESCGLKAEADLLAGVLPIGKLRLVELARAIVVDPTVLLLDEPTSGLGEEERRRFAELIEGIVRDAKPAVLLVEHDVDFVMGLSDQVLVLDTGRVLACGPPAEVQNDPTVLSAYIGQSSVPSMSLGTQT